MIIMDLLIRPCRSRPWSPVLASVMAVAAGAVTLDRSFAEQSNAPATLQPSNRIDPPRVTAVLRDIEPRFLELLAAGKQHDAEKLLDEELARSPNAREVVEQLAAGHVAQAMLTNIWHRAELRAAQRTLFLEAACERSRFDLERASAIFAAVGAINPQSPSGECALLMVRLDAIEPTLDNWPTIAADFAALQRLVEAESHDTMLRWMLAIECRQWNHNAIGAEQYGKILTRWKPGPALVHQTYANLLDNLKRYDEALAERRLTIKLEPAHWSYEGLANTLHPMRRFQECYDAHAQAVKLCPTCAQYFANWSMALNDDGKYDEAIEKCRRALALDPQNEDAKWNWARALREQGKHAEALEKYRHLQTIDPDSAYLKRQIAELEQKLAQ